ncbi:24090_t:CDS:2, partial [Gigaspora margarita]
MGRASSFKNKKIFEGLYYIMVQIADREQHKKGLQNLNYSYQFSDFLVILASLSPRAYNIFQQNLARHNTKIKERLGFFSLFGCIVGSILSTESTRVSTYEDIHQVVDMIKSRNAIASQVWIYLLQ